MRHQLPEWIALGAAFLLPLAFWPASPQPFSTAKDWLLAAWVIVGFAAALVSGRPKEKLSPAVTVATAIWIMAISLSAGMSHAASVSELIRNLVACAGFPLLLWIGLTPWKLALALSSSGTVVALIAILQWAGLDPFLLLNLAGSLQGNSRIRIFSTLGNPNYVAAFLTALLPLTFVLYAERGGSLRAGRIFAALALLVQTAAIVMTGSRAPILGLIAAGIWFLIHKAQIRLRWLLAGLAVCGILLLLSPARPLEKTLAGRIYIWRLAVTHITQIPPTGYGPGAFPMRFAQWETAFMRANPESPDLAFSGFQDHAHNDYVEFLVDYGIVGLCAFFLAVGFAMPHLKCRARSLWEIGTGASVVALLAVAGVDFPLHRPAELFLFWTQLANLWILMNRP